MNCSWLKSIVQEDKAWRKYNKFQCNFEISVPHGQSSVATEASGAEIPEVALKIKLVKSEIAVAAWAFLTGAARKPISSGCNDTQENVSISAARREYHLINRESCQSTRNTIWCCKERETKEIIAKGAKSKGKPACGARSSPHGYFIHFSKQYVSSLGRTSLLLSNHYLCWT